MRLCEEANMFLIVALDKEVDFKKAHHPIKFDKNNPMIDLGKGVEVESGMIMYDGVQAPAIAVGTTQNMKLSVPKSIQVTSS